MEPWKGPGCMGNRCSISLKGIEGHRCVLVVNAQHIKAVPGRKTDTKDAEWIADLLQHGLLKASFLPSAPQRELRELTRSRVRLSEERTRDRCRLLNPNPRRIIAVGAIPTFTTYRFVGSCSSHQAPRPMSWQTPATLPRRANRSCTSLTARLHLSPSSMPGSPLPHSRHPVNTLRNVGFSLPARHRSAKKETILGPLLVENKRWKMSGSVTAGRSLKLRQPVLLRPDCPCVHTGDDPPFRLPRLRPGSPILAALPACANAR